MLLDTEIGAIILAIISQHVNAAFTVIPSPIVVGQEVQAQFNCSYSDTNLIEWIVNNSTLGKESHPGISQKSFTTDGGIYLSTLTIMAFPNYNETEVVCEALIRTGDVIQSNKTPPVHLLIQGPLNMVLELQRNSSTITWMPPFTLDLTGVDPDIVYCVEVYNITCGVDGLVVGDCNVTEPRYLDSRLQQGHIYRITITPRSNGQNGQNGTSNTKEEMFTFLTDPEIVLARGPKTDCVSVQIRYEIIDGSKIEPKSYSFSLSPIDGVEVPSTDNIIPTSFVRNASTVTVNVTQPLPCKRLWSCQVLALGCHEHQVTDLLELSTHDFQNVTVNSISPGEIRVTGYFINGSTANGIFVVVYPSSHSDSSDVYYMLSSPSNEEEKLVTDVRGLPAGLYNVAIFVEEENGLPFSRSAITPRNVSVTKGENRDKNFQIKYELHPNSTHVCITCTFLDSSPTECVAVVHQQISQLNSSGLMNIKSSHRFNRFGDTAYGCIPEVDLEQYQIGVVGRRVIEPPLEHDSQVGVIVGVTVGISVPGVCSIAIGVTVVIIWKKKKRQTIHEKSGGESSSMRPLTATKGKTQSQVETGDPAYDVLQHGSSQPSGSAKVEGLVPTSKYDILDLNIPTGTELDPSSAPSELAYATVGPSPMS